MKLIFALCFIGLATASALLHWTLPEEQTTEPVIHWITQNDPVKRETIRLFRGWLADQGLPPIDLRIDNANQGLTKKLVQGVSGVGADVIDIYGWEFEILQATGMISDVTDDARRLGFGPDATYPAARTDIMLNGRQYGFPRNVDVTLCWVNRETFARHGIPEPPRRWTWEDFEDIGKRFVAAANPPGTRQRVYFLNLISRDVLRRGTGLSTFNETLTRCTLDDPRNVEVLSKVLQWTRVDRLMPTQEEAQSFAADAAGFDLWIALFARGQMGMLQVGRWALIRLRPRGQFSLAAVEPPHRGFPNTLLGGGLLGVYAGSRHRDLAVRFLQFLASEPFNMLIATSGDSLPPVPAYADTEAFRRPPDFPGEWGTHEVFSQAGAEIGISASRSPFVLPSLVQRVEQETYEAVLAGRLTPEQAARSAAARINAEIEITIRRDAELRAMFEERKRIQEEIEARRAQGLPVPESWLNDPFHLAYYRSHGWTEQEQSP